MVKAETLAVIYYNDPENDPGGWTEVMPLDEAIEKAKEFTEVGFESYVFKLTETHYFKVVKK